MLLFCSSAVGFADDTLLALNVVEGTSNRVLTGVAEELPGGRFRVRTADSDVVIEAPPVGSELEALLNGPQERIQNFSVPPSQIAYSRRVPFGTRGDCSELPYSVDEVLETVRNGPENMTLVDFLQSIPDGSMESFTLITNTRSLQRGEGDHLVNEEWPRVLRSTMDGKLTISFVCHPDQEKHNSVEIIYFDDDTGQFETLSLDFNKPRGETTGGTSNTRIHHSPQSCVACHGTSDKNGQPGSEHIKLNWPEYFFWGDCDPRRDITMYGMVDDNMDPDEFRYRGGTGAQLGCNMQRDQAAHRELVADFVKFQEKAQTDPCLGTLPWAEMPDEDEPRVGIERSWTNEDYQYYPYAARSMKTSEETSTRSPDRKEDIFNYSLRTNLRFTDTYGHLTALRNLNIFRENPNYEFFRYYLAAEALGPTCVNDELREEYAERLGVEVSPRHSSRTNALTYPLMVAFGEDVIGMQPEEWGMHVPADLTQNPRQGSRDYNTAIPADNGEDFGIHDIMMGELVKDIGQTDEEVQAALEPMLTNGVEYHFGERFSCIDDLGQGISRKRNYYDDEFQEESEELCNILKARIAALEASGAVTRQLVAEESNDCDQPEPAIDFQEIVRNLMQESQQRGRSVASRCVGCHSGSSEIGFISNNIEPDSVEIARLNQYARDAAFWDKVQGHLRGELEPRMPFGCDGESCLSQNEQADLIAYLRFLTSSEFQAQREIASQPSPEDAETVCNTVNSTDRNGVGNTGVVPVVGPRGGAGRPAE